MWKKKFNTNDAFKEIESKYESHWNPHRNLQYSIRPTTDSNSNCDAKADKISPCCVPGPSCQSSVSRKTSRSSPSVILFKLTMGGTRVAQSYPPTRQLTFPPTWQLLTYLKVMEDLHHHLLDHLPIHLPDSDGAAYVWAGRSRREDTVKKAAPHIVLLFSPQHGILCILLASPDHWSSWSVSINYCVILRAHSLWPPKSPHGFHSLIWNKPENPDEDARVSYSVSESSKTHKQKHSADGILPWYVSWSSLRDAFIYVLAEFIR